VYDVEVASCGIIYVPSFMKIGAGVMLVLLMERHYKIHR
jgi:hypothetical protein